MSAPWPPPPDLESIQELVRNADVEGLIAVHGAPADEYSLEGEKLFAAIGHLPTGELLPANLLPQLERIWAAAFNLSPHDLDQRRPALLSLAKEIERFFGPESKPRTRSEILMENNS